MRFATVLAVATAAALVSASPERLDAHEGAGGAPEAAVIALPSFDYDPPAPGSYRLQRIKPAADGLVLDTRGRELSLRPLLEGKLTVLSFIYTRCADVCSMASVFLHDLRRETLENERLRHAVQFISFSFDPEHDTPETMAAYASAMGAEDAGPEDAGSWAFLTTAGRSEVEPLLEAYDQPVMQKPDLDDLYGPIAHQLRLYLIDRKGWIRNIYSLDFMDPRLMLADLETLLIDEDAARVQGRDKSRRGRVPGGGTVPEGAAVKESEPAH